MSAAWKDAAWGMILAVGVVFVAEGGWWVLLGATMLGAFASKAVKR